MEKEPLNDTESIVFAHLNEHLKLPVEEFVSLTEPQKFSAARVIAQQGYGVKQSHNDYLCGYLGIRFKHIFIGIEKDGYAHS